MTADCVGARFIKSSMEFYAQGDTGAVPVFHHHQHHQVNMIYRGKIGIFTWKLTLTGYDSGDLLLKELSIDAHGV